MAPIDSSFHPWRSSAGLIVYIDYKSPYAYIAKDPTYELADELGIEIDWRPLTLDIPSYLGPATVSRRGKVVKDDRSPQQWQAVRHAYHDVRRYANLRGLTVRGPTKIWDSSWTIFIGAWIRIGRRCRAVGASAGRRACPCAGRPFGLGRLSRSGGQE